ncbi:flagellar basal body protein [Enterobacteriaceae bacterium LUAb1]
MGISFDKALSIHPAALQHRLSRAELLSANLANVDTPNYKAKDIDFATEMQRSMSKNSPGGANEIKYRVPYHPTADGNTVSLDVEQAEFSKNSLDYQTSLQFLNAKFLGMKQAIEGK